MHAKKGVSSNFGHNVSNFPSRSRANQLTLPVFVSIAADGHSGSAAAHMARAALSEGKRVLLVDLTDDGSLGAKFPPRATPDWSMLTSTKLFDLNANVKPEVLADRLSIIRADGKLDQAPSTVGSKRLQNSLMGVADDFDMCFVEICDVKSLASTAALANACGFVSPNNPAGDYKTYAKWKKTLDQATEQALAVNPRLPGLTFFGALGEADSCKQHELGKNLLFVLVGDMNDRNARLAA